MTVLSLILPEINKPDSTEDPKINTALTTIQNWANGNIDTTNVKDESLTGKDLGAETIRVLSTSAYTALTSRAMGNKFLASASRPTWVSVVLGNGGSPANTECQILVGGVLTAKFSWDVKTTNGVSYSFLVPAGVEWEPKATAGVFTCESSYLTL